MQDSKQVDPMKAAKETEAKLLKLQGHIENLKQRIKLSESEERAEIEERNEKIKQNKLEIKKLKMNIEELQVRISKGHLGDEKIIARAFKKHSREVGLLKGKTGKEAVEILDGKVFDLIKKSDALAHDLQLTERDLADTKEQYDEMAWKCHQEFEMEPTESESQQRIRELENEYHKVQKNVVECEYIQGKYREMQAQLKRDLQVFPTLLLDLETEYRAQQADIDQLVSREEKAHEARTKARKELDEVETEAAKVRHEKERVIAEFNKALEPKPTPASEQTAKLKAGGAELLDVNAAAEWRKLQAEQETQLNAFHEAFEQIKEATGVSDINEAEARFISQKATAENLHDLKRRAERSLQELKEEKKQLEAKMEAMRGAELACPQVVLEDEIQESKKRLEEQEKRKTAASAELERITQLLADTKTGLWNQLQLLEKHMPLEDIGKATSPDTHANVIATKIEELLEKVHNKMEGHDVEALKKKMKDEQFLQKIEAVKVMDSPVASRKPKPPVEEELSDDEEIKKRTMLKKDAYNYAEIKKKQKGRGKIMML